MKSNNQINVPQAREAMDKFKMQAASEVGVNLTNGYNGHLTSREAGFHPDIGCRVFVRIYKLIYFPFFMSPFVRFLTYIK